eukprot:344880_1
MADAQSIYTQVLQDAHTYYSLADYIQFEASVQCLIASKLSNAQQISCIDTMIAHVPRRFILRLKSFIEGKSFKLLSQSCCRNKDHPFDFLNDMRLNILNSSNANHQG